MLLEPFSSCSAQTFGDLYLWCEGRFLEVKDTPAVDPPHHYCPPPHCCPAPPSPSARSPSCSALRTPPPPPPPSVITFEQQIAKNTQFYTNFHNFFKLLKTFILFCVFSALVVKEPCLGFYNRLLHSLVVVAWF